jgi:hypothetical protein|tara:strand:+ start:331 stop:501 length:171 start_codon:yes stop_codon:yes gene_type:complete
MKTKYKISITNYNNYGIPISGISRIISDLTFGKIRRFQNKYPGRVDLIRKLDIKEI